MRTVRTEWIDLGISRPVLFTDYAVRNNNATFAWKRGWRKGRTRESGNRGNTGATWCAFFTRYLSRRINWAKYSPRRPRGRSFEKKVSLATTVFGYIVTKGTIEQRPKGERASIRQELMLLTCSDVDYFKLACSCFNWACEKHDTVAQFLLTLCTRQIHLTCRRMIIRIILLLLLLFIIQR